MSSTGTNAHAGTGDGIRGAATPAGGPGASHGPADGTADAAPCDVCGARALVWRKCKLICGACGNINRSCADL